MDFSWNLDGFCSFSSNDFPIFHGISIRFPDRFLHLTEAPGDSRVKFPVVVTSKKNGLVGG
jgi:hypothetical protein